MRKLIIPILLFAATAAFAQDGQPVVLAAARGGRIEVRDSGLQLMATLAVNPGLESISISPDGHTMYLAQEGSHTGGCCGLFTLNLETHEMCSFSSQGMFATPSLDGRFIFTQGEHGVDFFDASNLERRLPMRAPGTYHLQPSPDGRWLLGITNSPKPSLDIFDMQSQTLARQLNIPAGPAMGAWTGEQFHILNYTPPGKAQLWNIKADDTKLPEPKEIQLRDLHAACNQPVLLTLAGSADRLFLAEAFGYKMDRRRACPGARTGGIYTIDPTSGSAQLIAPSVHVNRMVASPDGHDLYVLQSAAAGQTGSARLLHIDARSGNTISSATLTPDDWSLLYARIPHELVPHGYVRAGLGCAR
ncbi:MAG: hypothetical protein ABSH50_19630 [Bryobacteraceae bacterium]|jgi:hypothetical protein